VNSSGDFCQATEKSTGIGVQVCGSLAYGASLQFRQKCVADGESAHFNVGSSLRGWRLILTLYFATFGFRNYLWLRGA
jgi:hypothetical protein